MGGQRSALISQLPDNSNILKLKITNIKKHKKITNISLLS